MGVQVREKIKGSGVWWVFVKHQGRRMSKQVGNKWAAKEVAKKLEAAIAAGDFRLEETKAPTFGELAQDWLAITVPATCKASTASDYRSLIKNHVGPVFNPKPVDQITRLMVKDFLLGKIRDGLAASTVTHMKNCISGVLGRAVEANILEHNPALTLGRLYREKPKGQEITPMPVEHLSALLEAYRDHWPRYYPLVLTLARTGLRVGEALGLMWEDLDFDRRVVHVKRSLSRMQLVPPKSGKSRPVDMSPQLALVLQGLQTSRKREALAKGWGEVPDLVFVNRDGKPVDLNHFRARVWEKALAVAKLPHYRIHDLRHSYATMRIQAGHNVADVSSQLGHHSVKFTLDQYYHWLPGKAKNEVDDLDRLAAV